MSLDLQVDAQRWRAHLGKTVEAVPGLVPVAKGNGYGLGVRRLAAEAARLGVPALAVGTYAEVPHVRDAFPGDVLVLEPWLPDGGAELADERVIHTVADAAHLPALAAAGARVVLEQLTSMRRFGFDVAPVLADLPAGLRVEGVALHLPLGEAYA
ncbi:MAG: alanine racemase, partial [Actinomycetota bacterium]|nr:alanine racemase [Actinomycetota bacterium]